ncbi:phosphatidylserine decarboxylase 1 [Dimargaris verticillata]|uniref:Phosphatidylserine decarboxylase proenzyme 1, mitochondrial n=1 Tax=Dimargaris verticillata TaxID=2761393 RepID=A0A9W8E965_9FUNG|nr:phosphatidylserine decarboxylase 1 [Dimargaris verticillata]
MAVATRRGLSLHQRANHASGLCSRVYPIGQSPGRAAYSTHSGSQSEPKRGWQWISVGAGLTFLAVFQLVRTQWRDVPSRPPHNESGQESDRQGLATAMGGAVPEGPWQVHVLTALPLKAMSRLFGAFNDLTIPRWLREPSLKFYCWVFGCDLSELLEPDLKEYPNLGSFFYRALRPDARPIDPTADLVSPADGRVLNYGLIRGRLVEQVKGISYSLDAFLGDNFGHLPSPDLSKDSLDPQQMLAQVSRSKTITNDEEFAEVNGVTYTLEGLVGDRVEQVEELTGDGQPAEKIKVLPTHDGRQLRDGHELFFCVIYLSPADYHRFHSPTNWIVESRRHFSGELYSVSPYALKLINNLFVLNERVALLGRWRHGFMSMIPVGATNVGSIKINFDPVLRTNQKETMSSGNYSQMSYTSASALLQGVPLKTGEEVGGFRLGSTVVLVFEAPASFRFTLTPGMKIKVGQPLGCVESAQIS